jgi:hypothetical protein
MGTQAPRRVFVGIDLDLRGWALFRPLDRDETHGPGEDIVNSL